MLNLYVVGENYRHVIDLFDRTYRSIGGYLFEKSTIHHAKKNIEIGAIVSIRFISSSDLHKFLPGRRDYIRVNSDDVKDIIKFLNYAMRFRKWFDDFGSLIGPISSFEAEVSSSKCEVRVHLYSMESGVAIESPVFNFNSLTYQHLKYIEALNTIGTLNSLIGYSYFGSRIEKEIKKWLEIKNNKMKEGELDMSEAMERVKKMLEDDVDAMRYAFTGMGTINAINAVYGTAGVKKLRIEDVKFNGPATIVFWNDGTKTIVKCGEDDVLDREKGLAMAICKKVMGNKGNYYNEFKKWLEE